GCCADRWNLAATALRLSTRARYVILLWLVVSRVVDSASLSVILSCGHVVCQSCVNSMPRSQQNPKLVKCTICSVSGFFYPLPSEAHCRSEMCSFDFCPGTDRQLKVCTRCKNLKICQTCTGKHARTTGHTTYRYFIANSTYASCSEHNETYTWNCECGEFMCSKCVHTHWKNILIWCHLRPYHLSEYSRQHDDTVKKTLEEMKEIVDQKMAELEKCVDDTNEEIAETFKAIVAQALSRCLDLMKHVKMLGEKAQKNLIATRGNIDRPLRASEEMMSRLRSSGIKSALVRDYTESVATFLNTGNMILKNVIAAKITIKSLDATGICKSIAKLGEEMWYNASSLERAPNRSHFNRPIISEVTVLKILFPSSEAEDNVGEDDYIGRIVDGLFRSFINEFLTSEYQHCFNCETSTHRHSHS
ncbi:hypothetical protein PFISCL1PPCAC_20842, partial [Pristionchus fissidentatus]